jgi:hypothetical protein
VVEDTSDPLEESVHLDVRQQKEWIEILTDFEQRNCFTISDSRRGLILYAAEESSILARNFLGASRPFALWLVTPDQKTYLRLQSPFRFLFQEIAVYDPSGRFLGRIVRNFSFFHPRYTVYDAYSIEIFQIRRHLIEIWTYRIFRYSLEVGVIRKQWGGAAKEYFTDADTFRLTYGPNIRLTHKQILLAALFLIDKDFFEGNSSGGVEVKIGS